VNTWQALFIPTNNVSAIYHFVNAKKAMAWSVRKLAPSEFYAEISEQADVTQEYSFRFEAFL
jgi:hypothetical protein